MAYQPSHPRTRLIKLIHVAKRDLRLDDDTYRNVLHNVAGKSSSSELTLEELREVLEFFRQKGWKPEYKSKPGQKLSPATQGKADPTPIDKIRAMWLDLANRGLVKNRYEAGLNAFVKRVTRVENVNWLNNKQCTAVITALRAIENRTKKHDATTPDAPGTANRIRPELQQTGRRTGAAAPSGDGSETPADD